MNHLEEQKTDKVSPSSHYVDTLLRPVSTAPPPRILIVDDDRNIRLLLFKYLTGAGYRAYMAQDALGALRFLGLMDFHAVIADILLPDVSGTELLYSIRSRFSQTRVILMTGEPDIESVTGALRGGAFDYLTKPLKKSDLFRSVQKAVMMKELDDENRRLAEDNRRHQEHLEELVEERTEELAVLSRRIIEVQEEERTKLARELHDDLGQSLLALKLNLQNAIGKVGSFDESVRSEIDWSLNYLNEIIDKSRKISHNLSPASLENLGLPLAIRELTQTLNPDGSLKISLKLKDLDRYFPGNWDVNVYRLIQEALTNILKHAKATRVEISAVKKKKGISISIRDDGVGIPDHLSGSSHGNGVAPAAGLGLQIMKKRVDLLNGDLIIKSNMNRGTEVRFELP